MNQLEHGSSRSADSHHADYQMLAESLPQLVFVKDAGGGPLYFNQRSLVESLEAPVQRRNSRKTAIVDRVSVGYTRVSTDEQAERGTSLDDQAARLRAYSAAMAWGDLDVVVDAGESAKSLQRPGMTTLLDRVRRGQVGRVIITKLDRITRSTRDLADLLDTFAKFDVALVSIGETLDTSSAAGRLVVNLLATVSQWEREVIGERTASGLGHLRRQRRAYCRTPFGYQRVGDVLVEVPAEQAGLVEALRMDRDGATYKAIGAMLTERGTMPHRGRAWHPSCVSAVLRSRIALERAAIA